MTEVEKKCDNKREQRTKQWQMHIDARSEVMIDRLNLFSLVLKNSICLSQHMHSNLVQYI
jgi:hypothetical protein